MEVSSNGDKRNCLYVKITEEELDIEHAYRVSERLGILCGAGEPTPEQLEIAEREADEAIERLRKESV